jgi:hypothetical protein
MRSLSSGAHSRDPLASPEERCCTASGTRVYGLARKRNLDAPGATKQPDGQISA